MEEILFYRRPFYYSWTEEFSYQKVAHSIFLICAVCAGVPAVIWAVSILNRLYKSRIRISAFIILLLLNDTLEILLDLYIITKLFQGGGCWETACQVLSSLGSASRICGVHLQQMVVLENIVSLRHPFCSVHVFFPCCSIMISIIAFICFFLCELFGVPGFLVFSLLPLLAVTVTSCIITCRTPPNQIHRSSRSRNVEYAVLPFAVFTMILYLLFLFVYLSYNRWNLWVMSGCLSLRVIIDPLLCVMICKGKLTETYTDPSTDQTSGQAEQSV